MIKRQKLESERSLRIGQILRNPQRVRICSGALVIPSTSEEGQNTLLGHPSWALSRYSDPANLLALFDSLPCHGTPTMGEGRGMVLRFWTPFWATVLLLSALTLLLRGRNYYRGVPESNPQRL